MGFFIRVSNKGFRIIEELWSPVRQVRAVPKEAYPALGFRYDMTPDEAKARAAQINAQERLESKKIAKAVRQKTFKDAVNTAYLPTELVDLFVSSLHETYIDNPSRLDTILKHWNAAQLLISALGIDPKDFYHDRVKILNYYKSKQWSTDYIKRINYILNLWGAFCAHKRNSFFQPIPKLTNVQAQKVVELREDKDGVRTPAKALEWDKLKNSKASFENEGLTLHWNWMYIALWFGLRPKELDNVRNPKYWNVTIDPIDKIKVLNIYQTKLTSLTKDKRWKPIPVFLPEQKKALELLMSLNFKRPLNKTLQRLLNDEGIETYSPRKGFVDLMLEHGFSLEDISIFLGHNDISITWEKYKNKKKYRLPNAG